MKRVVALLFVFMISFSLALNAEISTEIDSETSNFVMETDSSATSGYDAYDVEVPNFPDQSYAQLYSVVSGKHLMLDSSSEGYRTINLVYGLGSAVNESEAITFEWDGDDFDGLDAALWDCGASSWSDCDLLKSDMEDYSSQYIGEAASGINPRYFKIVLSEDTSTSPVDGGGGSGSGSGGGGGGGGLIADVNVKVDLSEINLNVVTRRTKEFSVNVTNLADFAKNVSLSQTNLEGVVVFDTRTVEVGPGETKEVVLTFVGPSEVGVYAGIIYIGGNQILTTVNVRTTELLFDAMIVVPEKFKKVGSDEKLETQVTLIPMGDEDVRVDVTLNYVIKDFEGNVYLIESETLLVDSQKSFKKEFALGNLVTGNYLIALELVYPNGVATSSSHFSIVEKSLLFGKEIFVLVGVILVILFVLIMWRINLEVSKKRRRGKKRR